MAEFCVDCWNEINERCDPPERLILSKELDLCEGCGEYKHIVIKERARLLIRILRVLFFPVCLLGNFLYMPAVKIYYDGKYKKRK